MRSMMLRQVRTQADPAPSRLSYRMQRLWLTPLFRTMMRVGLPVFVVVFGAGAWVSDPGNRERVAASYADIRRSVEERPEFMVRLMAIDGASPVVAEGIREIVKIRFPVSSFEIDLDSVREEIASLDAVAKVDLYVRAGGILQVDVTEREPAIVWRGPGGLDLLDAGGHRIASLAARTARADLPLVVGEGADEAVPEALALFAAAGPIADRVRGLVRIGARRWDVVLDGDLRILLPEEDPVTALERVIAIDEAQDLFARDLVAVDLRLPRRMTLRMAPEAVDELRRVRGMEWGVSER